VATSNKEIAAAVVGGMKVAGMKIDRVTRLLQSTQTKAPRYALVERRI